MKAMTPEARKTYVKQQAEQRGALKKRIQALSVERERFVAEAAQKAAPGDATLDTAVVTAVREQAQKGGYVVR